MNVHYVIPMPFTAFMCSYDCVIDYVHAAIIQIYSGHAHEHYTNKSSSEPEHVAGNRAVTHRAELRCPTFLE